MKVIGLNVYRNLHYIDSERNPPSEITIRWIVQMFQRTGSFENQRVEKYTSSGCLQENIDLVHASVVKEPIMSISRRSGVVLIETPMWSVLAWRT